MVLRHRLVVRLLSGPEVVRPGRLGGDGRDPHLVQQFVGGTSGPTFALRPKLLGGFRQGGDDGDNLLGRQCCACKTSRPIVSSREHVYVASALVQFKSKPIRRCPEVALPVGPEDDRHATCSSGFATISLSFYRIHVALDREQERKSRLKAGLQTKRLIQLLFEVSLVRF